MDEPTDEPIDGPDETAKRELLTLDRVVHEPARLLLLGMLANAAEIEFRFFENATGLTKGNLSSHLAKLEATGYVMVHKAFRGRLPVTSYRITDAGRSALTEYRDQLRRALAATEQGSASI